MSVEPFLEVDFGAQRGALSFEGVCGTLSGGRFWSSKRGALCSEGVRGSLLEVDFELDFGAQSGEL